MVFPIDVARRAMQIEEVNVLSVFWIEKIEIFTVLIHDWFLSDIVEPQSKEVCSSTCGMKDMAGLFIVLMFIFLV